MSILKLSMVLCGTALALSGCVSTSLQPIQTTELAASRASGVENAVVFRTDAGEINNADVAGSTLTLSDAVRLALQRDSRIQAALSRVRMAEADSEQSRLLPNPVIDVALRFPSGGKPIIDANLTAELVAILQRPGRVSVADNQLRKASAEAVTTVLDVLTEVRQQYVATQTLDALIQVLGGRRTINNRLLELARSRLAAGEATQLDVTTVETQAVEIEAEIADKEIERRQARLSLTKLIGRPAGDASWSVTPWQDNPATAGTEQQWIDLATTQRPEVKVREWELGALNAERDLTRFAPLNSATAGVASERDGDWSVGPAVSVPLPIFDQGQATRARASAAVTEAQHNLREAQRAAIEEVRQAYAAYTASTDNLLRVKRQLMPLQEQRLAQAEAQYKAGSADITSLFLAEQDLQSARGRLLDLQRKATESVIRLERAAGGPGTVSASLPTTMPATSKTTP